MKEEGLSEFIKIAYKYNRVKDVEEAFIDFPVEEEWHKGNSENILNEEESSYSLYDIGDIVFVNSYVYKNGIQGKKHFFVIIDKNYMAIPIEYFGMLISSKIEKIKYNSNKLLKKDEKNKLHKDSIVKTDVIYKINSNQIEFKIGTVDKNRIEEYKEEFYKKIKEKNNK